MGIPLCGSSFLTIPGEAGTKAIFPILKKNNNKRARGGCLSIIGPPTQVNVLKTPVPRHVRVQYPKRRSCLFVNVGATEYYHSHRVTLNKPLSKMSPADNGTLWDKSIVAV